MDVSKSDDTLTLPTLIKASLKNWKVFAICLILFSFLFYGYYGLLKKEYESKALVFTNLERSLVTKYGVYSPKIVTVNNFAKFLQDPTNLGSDLKNKYSMVTSITDNTTIILKLTSSDSNVHIKLKEVIENFSERIDDYFKNEMRSFFVHAINNDIEKARDEIKSVEKQMINLKAIEEDVSLLELSKDELKKINNLGLSIDIMGLFSHEREGYEEYMFFLKRKHIEKEVHLEQLNAQLEELLKGKGALEKTFVSNQLMSVFYPRLESDTVDFELHKKVLLGAILGLLVAFFIVFFNAMRRSELLNND